MDSRDLDALQPTDPISTDGHNWKHTLDIQLYALACGAGCWPIRPENVISVTGATTC